MITSGSGIGDAVVIGAGSPCFPTAIDGYTGFSFNPSGPVGGGPLLGLYPDPLVFAILSVPPSPGNLFHFLFDGMSYPDAPISFPPGTFTPLAGISMDALQIYLNAGSAQPLVYVSAVSRVTF